MRLNMVTTFNTWTWEDYSLDKNPFAQHTTCKFCCKHSLVIQSITISKQKSMAQLTVQGWVEQRRPARRKWFAKKISSSRTIARRSFIRDNNHSPPSTAEVKNECSYTSTPPTCFQAEYGKFYKGMYIQPTSQLFANSTQSLGNILSVW
jgi:hypothetical protein